MPLRFIPERRRCPSCRAVFSQSLNHCPNDGSVLQSLPQDPLIGSTVSDRYLVQSIIAVGGTGRVYRAFDGNLKTVALKVLYGELAARPDVRRRFLRAAEIGSRISHPNVVSVLNYGETPSGTPFLVTQMVQGRLLADLIADEAPLRIPHAVRLFREICRGVQAIHDGGVVHRDLTSANVMLCGQLGREVPMILTSGIAILAGEGQVDRLTSSCHVVGTPTHIAPERLTSNTVDFRADLFSLGIVFYRMLSGAYPYAEPPIWRSPLKASDVPPRMAALQVPRLKVDSQLEAIVLRLIELDPDDRYENISDLIAALDTLSCC